ncbi:MAG: DUF3455 domain-containing protein [Polaromonas sp.]|nr:DUF3455 domain-containing protein [Polaromonas sp.]
MTLRTATASASVLFVSLLAACGSMSPMQPMYSQASLPATVQVPAGNKVAMETVGVAWESMDGSKLTATQVAVAPNGMGNIPSQLVKGNPAMGSGAMSGVTYIQRVDTKGGVAPAMACAAGNVGAKETVKYQADYIFYKAM